MLLLLPMVSWTTGRVTGVEDFCGNNKDKDLLGTGCSGDLPFFQSGVCEAGSSVRAYMARSPLAPLRSLSGDEVASACC